MKTPAHLRLSLVGALAWKDLIALRWYAAILWGAALAALLVSLTGGFGWELAVRIARTYALSPVTFVAYLGILASVTLDCPWSARSFALGKPVSPGLIHVAKLAALIVAFGLPVLLLPQPNGRLIMTSATAVTGYLAFLLLGMHTALPFPRPVFVLLVHGTLFVALVNVVGFRLLPIPRFDEAGIMLLWDLWLAAGLFLAAGLRSRWAGVACSAVVLAVFAVGGFTLRRF